MAKITVVGMGPGDFELMSLKSWEVVKGASILILRTEIHPTVDAWKKQGLKFSSFDKHYEAAEDFEALYSSIVAELIKRSHEEGEIVYAVPGSPLVAERTVSLLREQAEPANIELVILPGMSFVEVLCTRLGLDPIDGLTIVDAADIERLPFDLFTGCIITQVYNTAIASQVKLSLMESLPDEYEIIYTHNLGLPDESIRTIPLYELDRQTEIDHLTSLYLPPHPIMKRCNLSPLMNVLKALRSPGGCPWDQSQTSDSLRKHLLEETYEVLEAIDLKRNDLLCEELGDLLLQIVFQAHIAEESGTFSMQNVIDDIVEKLIRRHPQVFNGTPATDWEELKRREKKERQSILDGIPKGMPALLAAEKLQKKAASTGFTWTEIAPIWDKCNEEYKELHEAVRGDNKNRIEEEFGDLLFSFVNLSRFLGINAELSLLAANRKFIHRFSQVEKYIQALGGDWQKYSLNDLYIFWKQAKFEENL